MKRKAILLAALSSLLFATSCIFVHYLTPFGFTPMEMTAMRGVVSAVLIVVYVFFHNRKLFRAKPVELLLFFCSGLAMFSAAFCYYESIGKSGVATAVVLMYTSPIYVLAFSVLFLKEKLTAKKIICVTVMLFGVVLVSGILNGSQFNFLGVLLGLLAGFSFGMYNIVTKITMKRGSDPMTAMTYSFIFMGLISLLFVDVSNMAALTAQSPVIILILMVGIGVFTCFLSYLIYAYALKDLPAGVAAALGLIEPVAAIVYGVILFGDELTWVLIAGIVLILGAVFVMSRVEE